MAWLVWLMPAALNKSREFSKVVIPLLEEISSLSRVTPLPELISLGVVAFYIKLKV